MEYFVQIFTTRNWALWQGNQTEDRHARKTLSSAKTSEQKNVPFPKKIWETFAKREVKYWIKRL